MHLTSVSPGSHPFFFLQNEASFPRSTNSYLYLHPFADGALNQNDGDRPGQDRATGFRVCAQGRLRVRRAGFESLLVVGDIFIHLIFLSILRLYAQR